MFFEPNRLEEIAQHLESMRKDLYRLTEGYAKVHVVTQTRETFLKDREERRRKYEYDVTQNTEVKPDDNP